MIVNYIISYGLTISHVESSATLGSLLMKLAKRPLLCAPTGSWGLQSPPDGHRLPSHACNNS